MNSSERPPTDYRGMQKRYERELLVGAILLLVVVGGGLIGLFFGFGEMLAALPCLLAERAPSQDSTCSSLFSGDGLRGDKAQW